MKQWNTNIDTYHIQSWNAISRAMWFPWWVVVYDSTWAQDARSFGLFLHHSPVV
jgi:hypothetical protein